MPKGKIANNEPAKSTPEYFKKYPFVSVCTPTFNRRPFIPAMLTCFNLQDYPQDRMEWIIIDDGTDPVEDLVASHPRVKYFKYDTKMTLGKKRNLLHEKSRGEILVYMDDDDYYPPERVSHAVHMLVTHPDALCAGSSEIYIYFKHIGQMKKFGPYGPNHATAGTFAFKRKLLKNNRYNDDACLAEERAFLKDYTVPFVQLNPMKVILVFSHEHNTFDKRKLLVNASPEVVKDTPKKVMDFIKDAALRKFYMVELEKLLVDYLPGRPEMKPDVIAQTLQLEREREKMAQEHERQNSSGGQIVLQQDGQPPMALTNQQVVEIMQKQQRDIQNRDVQIVRLQEEMKQLRKQLSAVAGSAVTGSGDNELKVVEITEKQKPEPEATSATSENTTAYPRDFMKRYEALLDENRVMRKLLDDLGCKDTDAGAGVDAGADAGPVVMV
jgi:hypothetical protein